MRLHDFLEFHARIRPEADFAVMGPRTMSWREADVAANRLANAMAAAGLRVGDRIAVLSKNCSEYLVIYFACAKAGVVPVPLNYRLAPPEWAYIIGDAGARILIARGELVGAIAPVKAELKVERFVAIEAEADGWESFAEFTAACSDEQPDRGVTDEHDLYQMYTSGTTGRPKGAVLQHRALAANLQQAQLTFQPRPGERTLIVAPMYHVAAGITMFSSLAVGGCIYVQEEFDPAEVVRAMSEDRISMALLVPVMIQMCLVNVPDAASRSYSDLRLIVYGGSAIAEQTLRNALAAFRCDFVQGYGMTELTAIATNLLPEDHRRALDGEPGLLVSAGKALLGTEVRVVDAEDQPVPAGTIGEVVVRGPQVMRGYWNRPDATEEALRGGWMHTGDAGTMDEEGFLYIQDRVKDMIVTGGENVYPREIEELLYQHPAVAEAAVIGVPDATWGEAIKAIVVLRAGKRATAEELVDGLRGKLADYKHPRSVEFVAALPRNPSGKVLKRELREPYWEGHARRVGGVRAAPRFAIPSTCIHPLVMLRLRAPHATSSWAAGIVAVACSSGSPPPRVPGERDATAEPAPAQALEPIAAVATPTDVAAPAETVAAAAVTPAPPLDDASRCARLRELVDAATDLAALQRSLTADGPSLGLAPGESFETGRELISFCVTAEPVLSPAACLSTLGFDEPLVVRALTVKTKWSLANSRPRPGMKLATAAPRYGPAAVFPTIADPPRGRLQPGAPKELPIFSIDRERDAIIELCFVQRQLGEDEPT